ncbi:MAG: hypothetical protein ACE5HI_00970 [bacterium]
MNQSANKVIEIYTNLINLPDEVISKVFQFVENIKTKNNQVSEKQIGKLAGLFKVSVPENLTNEIRQARKELSSAILSKKI